MRDEEVIRRLPEVELIEDDELRRETLDALARGVPEYFWHVPATSSGYYHNPFSRGQHGLWIHVKMGFAVYERLVRSKVEQGLLTEHEADMGRSALLLHDMLKYGHKYDEGDSTVKNHDKLAGHWLRQHTELPQPVIRAVERHNGPWYAGPEPETELEHLVHESDMVASTKNVTPGIYKPSDELVERYPNIPRVHLE
jgi:hypothetical protein